MGFHTATVPSRELFCLCRSRRQQPQRERERERDIMRGPEQVYGSTRGARNPSDELVRYARYTMLDSFESIRKRGTTIPQLHKR